MADTTTVRIHPRTQRILERLQGAWNTRFGSRPSKQDLLEKALEFLDAHEAQFMEELGWKPMTSAQIARLHRQVKSLGKHFTQSDSNLSSRVDDIVYGEGP